MAIEMGCEAWSVGAIPAGVASAGSSTNFLPAARPKAFRAADPGRLAREGKEARGCLTRLTRGPKVDAL